MRDHRGRTFSYWRARFSKEPAKYKMQYLLEAAFNGTKVHERLWPPLGSREDDNYFQFINHRYTYQNYFCASFFGYEKGRIGQVIKESFDGDEIDYGVLVVPPDADGTERQLLDGNLYFLCFKNNLIVSQDRHLKARHLEHYLNAIFRRRCQNLLGDEYVVLERSIKQKYRGRIRDVHRINFSAPLRYSGLNLQTINEQRETERRRVRLGPIGPAWEALKALAGGGLEQFETGGFIDPREIEVTLGLAWKKKRGERSSDQVDALANAFGHVEEEVDVGYVTQSGTLKNDEIRLSERKNVLHREGMPDTTDIFDKMIEWHRFLVDDGQI